MMGQAVTGTGLRMAHYRDRSWICTTQHSWLRCNRAFKSMRGVCMALHGLQGKRMGGWWFRAESPARYQGWMVTAIFS